MAYNRLGETSAAEDVVHDVLLSLWQGRGHIKIEQLENYLATAVKYAVLAQIRKKTRERHYLNNNAQTFSHENTTEASVHFKQILEQVKLEVERLPHRCKLVFKCSREQGMQVKEIAETLNISPNTVENQITKAIRQLRLVTKGLIQLFIAITITIS